MNIIEISKKIALKDAAADGCYIDCNSNNAYATLQLARYASEGRVLSFVSEPVKVDALCSLLECNFQDNVHIISDKFSHVDSYAEDKVDGAFIEICEESDHNAILTGIEKTLQLLKINATLLFCATDNDLFDKVKGCIGKYEKRVYSAVEMRQINDKEMPQALLIERLAND